MAQAMVGFPAMSNGASLMDHVLAYEKLVNEYERLRGLRSNFIIGTLLTGISLCHVLVDVKQSTTYLKIRTRMLQREQSNKM